MRVAYPNAIMTAAMAMVMGGFWPSTMLAGEGLNLRMRVDPLTRYIEVSYQVPAQAPDPVLMACSWSFPGAESWQTARVWPFISDTGLRLASSADVGLWAKGELIERRAAGLVRTLVFEPALEAEKDQVVDVDFRLEIRSLADEPLGTETLRVQADNRDVVLIEDWTQALQKGTVGAGKAQKGSWTFVADPAPEQDSSPRGGLSGLSGSETPLPQLSYPLDLKGWYAIFVRGASGIRLRLSGDERSDLMCPGFASREALWRWAKMDRQNLVLKQGHTYTGWNNASIERVRFVPLSQTQVDALEGQSGEPDRFVAGYWEPYSWAFYDDVQETVQHLQCLTAFKEARISLVDTQIGRFGMKVVYETRFTDPLLYQTIGDPIGTVAQPHTDNVGRMQQFTNTLDATLRYCKILGLSAHANFGASNCYVGTPLQGDFSKVHPEWLRGHALRFEVPEVRQYALSLYRESLEIGAKGLSIDFCRYPETIDAVATCNTFLSELRALADEIGKTRGERVRILVRFPGAGVKRSEFFDYRTWAKEGWVDFLCPSNIQGRHLNIPMAPYLAAVKGSKCMLLPCVDALEWGLPFQEPFLWRVRELYEAKIPGVYVYQADGRILGRPEDRRVMRMLSSCKAIERFWEEDARLRPLRSKMISITSPSEVNGYHGWERLRFWVDGVPLGPAEIYLDGQLVNRLVGPPYLVGAESYESDGVIPPGEHSLKIRVQDWEGWLEQEFQIVGAGG